MKPLPIKLCKVDKDANGTTYIIPAAPVGKKPGGQPTPGCPEVQVWWARRFKGRSEETLLIRQEHADRATADVIELTFGQLYAAIEALNAAVEDI